MAAGEVMGKVGILLGIVAGGFAFSWWKQSQVPKDSKTVDTGEKTPDGKSIVEVTGVGGEDDGVKVKGYELPSSVESIKFPITVVVKPNSNLFGGFKAGEKVVFPYKRSDELVWIGKIGNGDTSEYAVWYPELKKSALGAT